MKIMNLHRFIPNRLIVHLIAIQVNVGSRMFLRSRSLSTLLNLFAGGGREIFRGTALFPDRGFYVADIGAFRGWYTVISSVLVGSDGRVFSFEPEPFNFEILRKVILLGRLKMLVPLNLH
jgi:hypothetical protein